MVNGTQIEKNGVDATFRCSMTIPRAGLADFPAVATSFDRWGAILHLDARQFDDSSVTVDDPVELDLVLPGHHSFGRRAMHCLGKAIQTSRDMNGQLWLVVRFHQLQIRPMSTGVVAGQELAALQATEGGDRDHGVVE